VKLLFIWPNKGAFGVKPIGISLLSSLAKKMGWETKLYDTTHIDFGYTQYTESGVLAKIFKDVDMTPFGWVKTKVDMEHELAVTLNEYQPDCIAVSLLSDERFIAVRATKVAKAWRKDIPVIWGGMFPTLEPEKALIEDGADFVCRGEGLEAFPEFLLALEKKEDLYSIKNIWGKHRGELIKNPTRSLMEDIDSLPFADWDIFARQEYYYKPFDGNAYIGGDYMTNWGCPYNCTYCVNHFLHKLYDHKDKIRRYSVERSIKELKFLKDKFNLQFLRFYDEDFLMRPTHVLRHFSECYLEEINLPFVIETNPHSVTEEKVVLLKNMNCVSATLAIETGNTELRKNLLKRVDSEADILRAFKIFNDNGIRTSCFIMLGLPFETRATYESSIDLVRRAGVRYPCVNFFFPFEQTELREIAIKNSFYDPEREKVYQTDYPALPFQSLTSDELVQMRNVFNLYVKLPVIYHSYIKRSESADDVGKLLREKILTIYDETVWANDGWFAENSKTGFYLSELSGILHATQKPAYEGED